MSSNREREATGTIRIQRLQAVVVRPNRRGTRDKVFALLERIGCGVREEDIIPPGTPDGDAVRKVMTGLPRVLVVPFHAHRGTDGSLLDGISFLRALSAASPGGFRWRVLMPVSGQGAASLELARTGSSGALDPLVEAALMTLDEDAIDGASIESRVERFLRGG